jgi:alkyl hydroperoxide reductase subunit AhpC
MRSVGDTFPILTLPACQPDGRIEPVSLGAFRGKWLVLVLWPLDFAPASAGELRAYSALASDFDLSGAVLLGASVDSVYTHQAWIRHAIGPLRLPLLADVSRELIRELGVTRHDGASLDARFIVNPEGVIVSADACAYPPANGARDALKRLHALQAAEIAAHAWPSLDATPYAHAA